jgi:uncharacterized protein YhjY with autotransporter beta-barrel domain
MMGARNIPKRHCAPSWAGTIAASALAVLHVAPVSAQALPPQSLTDPALLEQFNPLEQAAARANQGTFNRLYPVCGVAVTAECTADVLRVFQEAQGLVQTATEILGGNGDTEFSLGLDVVGLGFALRWTAAEEMAAQGSSTTEFAASQLGSLSARLTALRWGVSGPRTAYQPVGDDGEVRVVNSGTFRKRGGGASADAEEIFSRWSWYLDGSFGYGDKDPTDLEAAFDFDGQEITTGVDYRFSPALVSGLMFGYTTKEVDFNSAKSVVDGGIESDGYSALVYGLWEGEAAYVSGALGYQQLTHDTERRITYPSQNPLVPRANSRATSSTDSDSFLVTLGAGYAFRWSGFSVQPSLDLAYTDASVDGFVERSINLDCDPDRDCADSPDDDPFDLRIGDQTIESLDVGLGVKLDYVFTPSFGVLVPFVTAAYHQDLLNDVRRIAARYADAYELLVQSVSDDPNFNVKTDEPDDDYYTIGGGVTVVLQGGLMGFVQYMQVLDLDNYSDSVITGGIRYEFSR